MHIRILFDADSSMFEEDFEFVKFMIRNQITFIRDNYKFKGYVYQSLIYDSLGLKWNPYDVNRCWIYERDGELKIEFITKEEFPNKIWIDISSN